MGTQPSRDFYSHLLASMKPDRAITLTYDDEGNLRGTVRSYGGREMHLVVTREVCGWDPDAPDSAEASVAVIEIEEELSTTAVEMPEGSTLVYDADGPRWTRLPSA